LCSVCGIENSENEIYIYEDKRMGEDCAIKADLYPLGQTGLRRNKISENRRRLTLPKHEKLTSQIKVCIQCRITKGERHSLKL